ncbi:Com family DNA-binding transcriptional regulator [Neisseria sp. Ec49-e6-T10]|uniref:Com family DNA-binding transcriptional regulator n=1 Tax=Neisseria sp. Ec49-e6-T10 TaxID=3140744 RepID=UPI003EBDBFB9
MKEEIRCIKCNRKLCEADYKFISIKCPRCYEITVSTKRVPRGNKYGSPKRKQILGGSQ